MKPKTNIPLQGSDARPLSSGSHEPREPELHDSGIAPNQGQSGLQEILTSADNDTEMVDTYDSMPLPAGQTTANSGVSHISETQSSSESEEVSPPTKIMKGTEGEKKDASKSIVLKEASARK